MSVGARHLQPHGIIHGGVHTSLIETACSVGASLAAPAGCSVVGMDNHTSFLRSARAGALKTTASPLHCGRRSQLWRAEVRDGEGRVLATGQVRLMNLAPQSRAGGAGS